MGIHTFIYKKTVKCCIQLFFYFSSILPASEVKLLDYGMAVEVHFLKEAS